MKFECRKDIRYKTQTGTSCEKCNSKAFRLRIEPASSGLLDLIYPPIEVIQFDSI